MSLASMVAPASRRSWIASLVPKAAARLQENVEQLKAGGVTIEEQARRIAENWKGYDVRPAFFRDPFGDLLSLKSDVPVKAM